MKKLVIIDITTEDLEEHLISKGIISEGEKIVDYAWLGNKKGGITVQIRKDEYTEQQIKFLQTPIRDLDLTVRAANCLEANKIENLRELLNLPVEIILKFRNFGKKTFDEINQLLLQEKLPVLIMPN